MSRSDDKIWQVTKMPRGQLPVYRSQNIGGCATPVSDATLRLFLVNCTLQHILESRSSDGVFPLDSFCRIVALHNGAFTPMGWFEHSANKINPRNFFPIRKNWFFTLTFNANQLVQAVLHADKPLVRRILTTDPDLTQSGNGIDFSGRQFQFSEDGDKNTALTAIQAAIAAGDFAPNHNSIGLCELLFKELQRQYPDCCYQIFHDQALALYTKSLRFYARKQEDKIRNLEARQAVGEVIDDAVIQTAAQRHRTYLEALHSNDLAAIINAHTNPDPDPSKPETLDAQKNHVFQVNLALIDAIANASDADIQAILDDPMINSSLNNLLREFRAEFIKLSHEEIIFNPQHLINIFELYSTFYMRVAAADQSWIKRNFFWGHLVEFTMCDLPAAKAQIFANPGLYDMVEDGAENLRVFDYRYGGGCIFPPVVSPVDSHNKKLAHALCTYPRAAYNTRPLFMQVRLTFQNFCRATTSSFQNLLRGGHQHAMRAPVCNSVM